jgi:carbamoyl-phosphate synthase large subunit
MKVLVTGGGALLGQGIIRALRSSRIHAHVVAVDPNPLSAGLYWADSAHLVPMANASDYAERLHKILLAECPDIVFVGTDVELGILARYRLAWEKELNTQIVVSRSEVIAIADDKWKTYQFLKEAGFAYPESALPGDESRLIEQVGFPLVVKPRIGARSVGVHIVKSREDLARVLTPESIIQQCVATDADEYTAGSLTFGTCQATIVMRRTLRDGNTYCAFVEGYSELNATVRDLANALQAYGPANFQFRLTPDGEVKVFEINARFSGTTPLRAQAGFNEVQMVIDYLLEGHPIQQPTVKPLVILRHWSETVVTPEAIKKMEASPEDRT